MAKVKLIKPRERVQRQIGGPPGALRAYRDVNTDISSTMACGVTEFEDTNLPWHVGYCEYLYCLDGTLKVHDSGTIHELRPGDAIWIPAGTDVLYECKGKVTVVFAVYPNK